MLPVSSTAWGTTASLTRAGSIQCSHSGCLTSLFPQERVNAFTVTFIHGFFVGLALAQTVKVSPVSRGNANGFSVAG